MSMPTIELPEIDFEMAVSNLIASIALEEAGLAHILNAEGMKLQHVIAREDINFQTLLEVNESVTETVSGIAEIEDGLQRKLSAILKIVPDEPIPPDEDV